jgi:hypothetical protein
LNGKHGDQAAQLTRASVRPRTHIFVARARTSGGLRSQKQGAGCKEVK